METETFSIFKDSSNSSKYVIVLLLPQIEHMVKGHAAYRQLEEQARQKWAKTSLNCFPCDDLKCLQEITINCM